ncbi:MAG: hypothetical protein K2N51_19615 [Lachnospiraceae bacterium]|nr:hypothetical protein [Lachnospiraceae bacterium]
MVLEEHYCCITSNSAVGLSTFLSTLQYFLDKAYDMRYIFDQLHISNSSNYEKYLNSCNDLMLDFADFHATYYNDALQYLKRKMAELYIENEEIFEKYNMNVYERKRYYSVINFTADEKNFSGSLYDLDYEIHI